MSVNCAAFYHHFSASRFSFCCSLTMISNLTPSNVLGTVSFIGYKFCVFIFDPPFNWKFYNVILSNFFSDKENLGCPPEIISSMNPQKEFGKRVFDLTYIFLMVLSYHKARVNENVLA